MHKFAYHTIGELASYFERFDECLEMIKNLRPILTFPFLLGMVVFSKNVLENKCHKNDWNVVSAGNDEFPGKKFPTRLKLWKNGSEDQFDRKALIM